METHRLWKSINTIATAFIYAHFMITYKKASALDLIRKHQMASRDVLFHDIDENMNFSIAVLFLKTSNSVFMENIKRKYGDFTSEIMLWSRTKEGSYVQHIKIAEIEKLSKEMAYYILDKNSLYLCDLLDKYGYKNGYMSPSMIDIGGYSHLLVSLFKSIKYENFSGNFEEVYVRSSPSKYYNDVIVVNENIGSIHVTLYKRRNIFLEELVEHFKNFYSSAPFYSDKSEIHRMYASEVIDLCVKRKLFRTSYVLDFSGFVEMAFPFDFSKNLRNTLEIDYIVTGGICFDILLKHKCFEKYLNMENINSLIKEGDRYIFSGVIGLKYDKIDIKVIDYYW